MTKASDYAFNEGFDFVFDGQRGTAFINPYMDAYVESYEGRILGAAEEHNLPSYLLAGVVWIEAGGDPLELECFTATARAFAQGTDAADATSYGDISMQIRTAAETLGYDSANLHPRQRAPIVDSLMSPDQGIAIAAMHLSQWRDRQGRSGGRVLVRIQRCSVPSIMEVNTPWIGTSPIQPHMAVGSLP